MDEPQKIPIEYLVEKLNDYASRPEPTPGRHIMEESADALTALGEALDAALLKLEDADKELSMRQQTILTLNGKVNALEDRLDAKQKQLELIDKDGDEAWDKVEELQRRLEELSKAAAAMRAELDGNLVGLLVSKSSMESMRRMTEAAKNYDRLVERQEKNS